MEKKDKFFPILIIDISMLFLLLFFTASINAEDKATQHLVLKVSEVCIVGISGNPGNMEMKNPDSPGIDPSPVKDSTSFIHYTSTVPPGGVRNLTARWGPDSSAPSGCSLNLNAIPSGRSNEGISQGEIILSHIPQTIVSAIGSCVTGLGYGTGTQLEYTLCVQDILEMKAGESKSVSVVFTLTDIN